MKKWTRWIGERKSEISRRSKRKKVVEEITEEFDDVLRCTAHGRHAERTVFMFIPTKRLSNKKSSVWIGEEDGWKERLRRAG